MEASPESNNPTRIGKVGITTFLGVIWGGWAITFIFVCFRVLARLKVFRRLFWDDYFVLLAVLFSLASAIVWQVSVAHDMFELMDVTANVALPGLTFFTDAETYFKSSLAVIILFYSTLWSIKISFLIFFKRLGKNVTRLRLLWWPTLIFTIVSYGISVGTIPFRCLVDSISYITTNCNSNSAIKSQRMALALNCALDVLTDCAILLIPVNLLWGVQMKLQRKLAITGIFALVIVTIVFAMIRTIAVTTLTRVPDTSWLYMWSAIETTVAIIISCVASFRSLFAQRDTNSHPAEGGSPRTSKPKSIGFGKRKNRFRDPNDLSGILADDDDDNNNNNTQVDLEDRDSRDRITDMSHAQTANSEETIRVKKEISQVYETV